MAKVSQVSQEVLATMKSSEGSRETRPKTRVQELCTPRGPEAPQQTQQSALNQRNTIPDPSDTPSAPQCSPVPRIIQSSGQSNNG